MRTSDPKVGDGHISRALLYTHVCGKCVSSHTKASISLSSLRDLSFHCVYIKDVVCGITAVMLTVEFNCVLLILITF